MFCLFKSIVYIRGTDNNVQNVVLMAWQNREEPTSGGFACLSSVSSAVAELLEPHVQGTGLFFSNGNIRRKFMAELLKCVSAEEVLFFNNCVSTI